MNIRILKETGGFGDLLCTFPVVRAIKRVYPTARLHYYVNSRCAELASHCPGVDVIIPVEEIKRRFRGEAIDPNRRTYLKTDETFEHTFDLLGADFQCELADPDVPTKSKVRAFFEAVPGLIERDVAPPYWRGAGLYPQEDNFILFQPFSSNSLKDWTWVEQDKTGWEVLAESLQAKGYRVMSVVTAKQLLRDDRPRLRTSVAIPKGFDWTAQLVSRASLVVSPDTALLHLAAAIGRPAVGLFGLTSGKATCSDYPLHSTIEACESSPPGVCSCLAPCYCSLKRGYLPARCPRRCRWMEALHPDVVLERCLSILHQHPRKNFG